MICASDSEDKEPCSLTSRSGLFERPFRREIETLWELPKKYGCSQTRQNIHVIQNSFPSNPCQRIIDFLRTAMMLVASFCSTVVCCAMGLRPFSLRISSSDLPLAPRHATSQHDTSQCNAHACHACTPHWSFVIPRVFHFLSQT